MASLKIGTIDEFKLAMRQLRESRRRLVQCVLERQPDVLDEVAHCQQLLIVTHQALEQGMQAGANRCFASFSGANVSLNIADELSGLHKDIAYCKLLTTHGVPAYYQHYGSMLRSLTAECGREQFDSETQAVVEFLNVVRGRGRPYFITDWDGTMKTYSSQYVTCMQPAADASVISAFSSRLCHLGAVLTAGPLRGPGILDLTAISSGVLFGGSWGREWQMTNTERSVANQNISEGDQAKLDQFADAMALLVTDSDSDVDQKPLKRNDSSHSFSKFSMIGSGFQRKVDRVTLGVQSVCSQVRDSERDDYLNAIKQAMRDVDPNGTCLHLHEEPRDVEVCVGVGNEGLWSKADGVAYLLSLLQQSLTDHPVLVCGDTPSDLPMLQYAQSQNKSDTYTIFVTVDEGLRERVRAISPAGHCAFVTSPHVIHAAMAQLLAQCPAAAQTRL